MERRGFELKTSISVIIVSIICGIAFVWAAFILGKAVVRVKGSSEVIRVTGSASQDITSDLVIWDGRISIQAPDLVSGYKQVKSETQSVVDFLTKNGIQSSELSLAAVKTTPLYEALNNNAYDNSADSGAPRLTYRKIIAYQLTQPIEISSSRLDVIEKINRQTSDLIASGVNFQSDPPQYLYTKIGDAKVEILGAAAKDARKRAEQIAENTNSQITGLRFARMSPLQITSQYSTSVSSDGQYDTSSRQKKITAIVTMGFGTN